MTKKIKLNSIQRFLISEARKSGVSAKEIKAQTKRYLISNKLIQRRKYYESPLGLANLKRQRNAIYNKSISKDWNKLSTKEKQRLAIKSEKLNLKIKYYRYRQAKTKQSKLDAYEDYLHAKNQLKARVNEFRHGGRQFSKTYYIKRSTAASYRANNTTQTIKENWVVVNHSQELQDLLDQGVDYNQAIEVIFEESIKKGEIQPLAQGEGYGYIDKDDFEVISPV